MHGSAAYTQSRCPGLRSFLLGTCLAAGALGGPLLPAGEARACMPTRRLAVPVSEGEGKLPHNVGFPIFVRGGTPQVTVQAAGETPTVQLRELKGARSESLQQYLVHFTPTPRGGSVYGVDVLVPGYGNNSEMRETATLRFTADRDTTAPKLDPRPTVWASQRQGVEVACPSSLAMYVLGVDWPALDEQGVVRIFESTPDGTPGGLLAEVLAGPEPTPGHTGPIRVAIPGEPGRQICVRLQAIDLANNETPLTPVCCVDDQRAVGSCDRVEAPENPWIEPAPTGMPGGQPSGAPGDPPEPPREQAGGCTMAGPAMTPVTGAGNGASTAGGGLFPLAALGLLAAVLAGQGRRRRTARVRCDGEGQRPSL